MDRNPIGIKNHVVLEVAEDEWLRINGIIDADKAVDRVCREINKILYQNNLAIKVYSTSWYGQVT